MPLLKQNSQEYLQSLFRDDCFESNTMWQENILIFLLVSDFDLKIYSVGME